jgi:phosphohistidine phosphatase
MDLYVIRHAEAEPQDKKHPDDDQRPLTDTGVEQARLLAEGLQQRGVVLEMLVSSPLLRAQQTAEGIREHWNGAAPELETCADLAPGGKPRKVLRFLEKVKGKSIGVVGHVPDLGTFAGWLLGSRKVQPDFAKGGVALIRFPEGLAKGAGQLVWLVTPEWLTEPEAAASESRPQ